MPVCALLIDCYREHSTIIAPVCTHQQEQFAYVQVTQNYCSRTNLRKCYAMATGVDQSGDMTKLSGGAKAEEFGCDGARSDTVAGLCPELQKKWRDAMLKNHPEVVAGHMPRDWLQQDMLRNADG